MRYDVVLIRSDEGYAIHCPALPPCWSQGATREEALENIRDAIAEHLDYRGEQAAQRKAELVAEARREGCRVEECSVVVETGVRVYMPRCPGINHRFIQDCPAG